MKPHGEFQLNIQGRVIEVTIEHAWNVDGMRHFIEAFKQTANTLSGVPWAALVDLRNWELSTPDTAELMDDFQQWCIDHRQVYEAVIMTPSILAKSQMDRYSEKIQGKLEQQYFDDPDQAREWLISLGMYDEL